MKNFPSLKIVSLFVLALVLGINVTKTLAASVSPTQFEGDRTCDDLGISSGYAISPVATGNYTDGTISVSITLNNPQVDWTSTNTSTTTVLAVILTNDGWGNVYDYRPTGANTDTALEVPMDGGDPLQIEFCYRSAEITPTGQPTVSPQPTSPTQPTPTPKKYDDDTERGDHSKLGYNTRCDLADIEVTYDALNGEGDGVKDVEVEFSYNGTTKKTKTTENGRARVFFSPNGEQSVFAKSPTFPDQSVHITLPQNCPDPVVTTAPTHTSYAHTGTTENTLQLALIGAGLAMVTTGTYAYVRTQD